ncbi:hypothetical protein CC79DRAFT_1164358 [Sarocladium strictum]
MEVVGAIASVGAILGGSQKALAVIWSIPGIPEDWCRLKEEVISVRAILAAAAIQFSPTEMFQPHTLPVQSALECLEDIANELQTLLNRVTKEKPDPSSNTKIYKPSTLKWVYLDKFKKEIGPFLIRLHNAKMSLNLALTIAQRYESLAKAEAMMQALHNMEQKFAIMTIQTQALPDPVLQVQQLVQALQVGTNNLTHHKIEDITSPAVDAGGIDALSVSADERELRPLPSSCARFCFCRCHNKGWFSRVQCDYTKCRRNTSTRQATWHVDLGRWLRSYGVSISISASLRPRVAIRSNEIRYHLSEMVEEGNRDMIWRHFYGVHPMDTYESTVTVLEDALRVRNTILLEMLMSHWDIYFQQYGLNRRDLFKAQWLRENGGLSVKATAVLSKLISYGEVDHSFQSTALHIAIERGDMDGVGAALASDPTSVSMCNLEGNAPIHVAVAQETLSIAMMTMLKGAGADLEQGDRDDDTPLILASLLGDLEVVQWLLRQGVHVVDPNQRNASGNDALHHAVQSDKVTSVAIMKLLLEAGVHPSTLDRCSGTPLHGLRCCRGGVALCKSKVQLLISAGAKIDSQDKFGRTALMGALFADNSGAVGALVDAGASLKHNDQSGRTAFHFAALGAGEDTLSELRRRRTFCSSDVDPFSPDPDGGSLWKYFLWSLITPSSKPSNLRIATKAVCHSFDILYLQARNFTLQSRVAALQQIFALLQTKNRTRALSQLTMLVEQYESRSLWRTGVDMQPFRSIHLQLRDGDVFGALQALQEQVELLRRSMAISPWRSHSQWWDGPIHFEATPVEDCERRFAFTCRMREEGLARWQRWRMRRNVGDYVYTAEASLPQRAKMLWRLMSVRGQARGRRMRWTWTKSPYVSRRLSEERRRLSP